MPHLEGNCCDELSKAIVESTLQIISMAPQGIMKLLALTCAGCSLWRSIPMLRSELNRSIATGPPSFPDRSLSYMTS